MQLYVTKKMIDRFGPTSGCKRCSTLYSTPKGPSHTSACHERIKEKLLKKDGTDPLLTNEEWMTRVKKAEERERRRLDERYKEIYNKEVRQI